MGPLLCVLLQSASCGNRRYTLYWQPGELVGCRRDIGCGADRRGDASSGEPVDGNTAGESELCVLRIGETGVWRDGQQLVQFIAGYRSGQLMHILRRDAGRQ